MNYLKLLESILSLLIQQTLVGLKLDEGFKKFVDTQLDKIENQVGKTGIDSILVLPICDTIRKLLNVPDDDELTKNDLTFVPYFNLPKELYAKYRNSVTRAMKHLGIPANVLGWEFVGTFTGLSGFGSIAEENDYYVKRK